MDHTFKYDEMIEEADERIERAEEEVEMEIKYKAEENTLLRQKIRAGKVAEKALKENKNRMIELMKCYLGGEI